MIKSKTIVSISALLATTFLSAQAQAKPGWDALGNSNGYVSPISCSTCHVGTATENNVSTSYGLLFDSLVNDDFVSAASFLLLEPSDSDGDGFSNGQELRQLGGHVNIATIFPSLVLADITAAPVSAKAVDGGAVSTLSYVGTTFAGGRTLFEKASTASAPTTSTFMYTFGGVQAGATASFYDENNNLIAFLPANTADGGYVTTLLTGTTLAEGSMNITVTDNGVFDLYSTTAFQRIAKARVPTFTPVVSPNTAFDATTTVDPLAKISPTATIANYATVGANAIVDAYATVGAYAVVGAYAYIAPSVDVYTQVTIDPYVEVLASITAPVTKTLPTGAGYISSSFAITTTQPATTPFNTVGDDGVDGESSGGLHCMTSGLGTQGLMFFALLAIGFLVRRKTS